MQNPVLQHRTSQVESTRSTWSRFEIPTKNESLSSGFPFHPRLYDLKITHDQWHLFSSDIVAASKLSAVQDYLAWTAGITVGTLTTPLLLVFSPWIGYISGRAVHRKTIQNNVKEKLLEEGDLRSILRRWNETFMQKGFQAWLELPQDPRELHKEYQFDETLEKKGPRYQKKAAKKAAKRFRIIIMPNDDPIAQSRSSLPTPVTPLLVRAPVEREAQELPVILAEPPAYENGIHGTSPISRSEVAPAELVELDAPPPLQYNRPAGFTNT
jgi:hypothetical protein